MITPTWQRHDLLLGRCVPSVQAQGFRNFEHLIVSDGPDPVLAGMQLPEQARLIQLPDHDPAVKWGHRARLAGIALCQGDLVAYLDDDDAYRPDHLRLAVDALAGDPAAGFAYPRMAAHMPGGIVRIGDGFLGHGRIGTSMIVHRTALLSVATWQDVPGAPDWDLVRRWLDAGVTAASIDAITVDYYPGESVDWTNRVPVTFRPWRAACISG